MIGWHFLKEDQRLQFGERKLVRVGEIISCDGALKLCENGLHASARALDALVYAPGSIVCLVELSGEILEGSEGSDKVCARSRRVLAMADATETLHLFACWCAEKALCVAGVTDERCWDAIEAKSKWLRGEISDVELAAARDVAWVARAAAGDAAWAAAQGVAWAAAWDAARAVAQTVAWAAAWAAARDAAGDAAWAAAQGVPWAAAWDDAWDAARDAARDAQRRELERMFFSLFKNERRPFRRTSAPSGNEST